MPIVTEFREFTVSGVTVQSMYRCYRCEDSGHCYVDTMLGDENVRLAMLEYAKFFRLAAVHRAEIAEVIEGVEPVTTDPAYNRGWREALLTIQARLLDSSEGDEPETLQNR